MCRFWEVGCKLKEVAVEAADSAVSQVAQSVLDGINNTLVSLGTTWVNVPTLNLRAADGPFQWVAQHTEWIIVFMLMGATMVVFARMAFTRSSAGAQNYLSGVLSFVVVSGAGVTAMALLVEIADETARWFIGRASMDTDFAVAILDVVGAGTMSPSAVGFMVIIVGGLLGLLANLVQIGLIFVRNVLLVLVGAFVVLSFALPGTQVGKAWSKQLVGWFAAFLLYKPVASIIYAIGIKATAGSGLGDGFDDLATFMVGVCILVFAPIALPALLAFVVPSVSAMTSGGGGGGGAGMAMAAGAAATGAMQLFSSSSSSSSDKENTSSSQQSESTGSHGGSSATGSVTATSSTSNTPNNSGAGAATPPGNSASGASGDNGTSGTGTSGAPGASGVHGSSGAVGASGASGTSGASGAAGTAGSAAAGAATAGAATAASAAIEGINHAVNAVQGTVESQAQGPTGASEAGEIRE